MDRRIRLLFDIPVEDKHGMTAGRQLDVLEEDRERKFGGGVGGRLVGYWVQGDAEERVKILKQECEVIGDP